MDVLERVDDPQWYVRGRIGVRPHPDGAAPDNAPAEAWVYFGGEPGFAAAEAAAELHAGPIAEYTHELAARLPVNVA
jgi:hypothetical protein